MYITRAARIGFALAATTATAAGGLVVATAPGHTTTGEHAAADAPPAGDADSATPTVPPDDVPPTPPDGGPSIADTTSSGDGATDDADAPTDLASTPDHDSAPEPNEAADDPDSPSSSSAPDEPVDTEVIDGEPGLVSGNDDVVGGRSTPPPSTDGTELSSALIVPSAPDGSGDTALDPIDILQPGGNGPDGPAVATDFEVNPDTSLDYAPNVSGCALQCVSSAVLTPNLTTPNVGLDVATTVPARIDIELTHVDSGEEMLFTSSGYKTAWSTTLAELDADAEYDLVLEAFDEDGQRRVHTHTFTTRGPIDSPDQLADNAFGCAGSCITRATVSPTDRPDEVRIDVATNTKATVDVWLSASEPTWADGTPAMPPESKVEPTLGIRTEWSVERAFLDPDTRYHVVVRAEDERGNVEFFAGNFLTNPPPPVDVRLTFEQIYVKWDGDPHWGGLDRGELSFAWGLHDVPLDPWDDVVGRRSQEKMDGGTTVVLEESNVVWQTIADGERLRMPGVTVMEEDDPPGVEFGAPWVKLVERPVDGYYVTYNPAWGPALTLEELETQERCGEMGLDHALPTDHCVRFESLETTDDDFARISVIVSYHVDR